TACRAVWGAHVEARGRATADRDGGVLVADAEAHAGEGDPRGELDRGQARADEASDGRAPAPGRPEAGRPLVARQPESLRAGSDEERHAGSPPPPAGCERRPRSDA